MASGQRHAHAGVPSTHRMLKGPSPRGPIRQSAPPRHPGALAGACPPCTERGQTGLSPCGQNLFGLAPRSGSMQRPFHPPTNDITYTVSLKAPLRGWSPPPNDVPSLGGDLWPFPGACRRIITRVAANRSNRTKPVFEIRGKGEIVAKSGTSRKARLGSRRGCRLHCLGRGRKGHSHSPTKRRPGAQHLRLTERRLRRHPSTTRPAPARPSPGTDRIADLLALE